MNCFPIHIGMTSSVVVCMHISLNDEGKMCQNQMFRSHEMHLGEKKKKMSKPTHVWCRGQVSGFRFSYRRWSLWELENTIIKTNRKLFITIFSSPNHVFRVEISFGAAIQTHEKPCDNLSLLLIMNVVKFLGKRFSISMCYGHFTVGER